MSANTQIYPYTLYTKSSGLYKNNNRYIMLSSMYMVSEEVKTKPAPAANKITCSNAVDQLFN